MVALGLRLAGGAFTFAKRQTGKNPLADGLKLIGKEARSAGLPFYGFAAGLHFATKNVRTMIFANGQLLSSLNRIRGWLRSTDLWNFGANAQQSFTEWFAKQGLLTQAAVGGGILGTAALALKGFNKLAGAGWRAAGAGLRAAGSGGKDLWKYGLSPKNLSAKGFGGLDLNFVTKDVLGAYKVPTNPDGSKDYFDRPFRINPPTPTPTPAPQSGHITNNNYYGLDGSDVMRLVEQERVNPSPNADRRSNGGF